MADEKPDTVQSVRPESAPRSGQVCLAVGEVVSGSWKLLERTKYSVRVEDSGQHCVGPIDKGWLTGWPANSADTMYNARGSCRSQFPAAIGSTQGRPSGRRSVRLSNATQCTDDCVGLAVQFKGRPLN